MANSVPKWLRPLSGFPLPLASVAGGSLPPGEYPQAAPLRILYVDATGKDNADSDTDHAGTAADPFPSLLACLRAPLLAEACQALGHARIPVLARGGITLEPDQNGICLDAAGLDFRQSLEILPCSSEWLDITLDFGALRVSQGTRRAFRGFSRLHGIIFRRTRFLYRFSLDYDRAPDFSGVNAASCELFHACDDLVLDSCQFHPLDSRASLATPGTDGGIGSGDGGGAGGGGGGGAGGGGIFLPSEPRPTAEESGHLADDTPHHDPSSRDTPVDFPFDNGLTLVALSNCRNPVVWRTSMDLSLQLDAYATFQKPNIATAANAIALYRCHAEQPVFDPCMTKGRIPLLGGLLGIPLSSGATLPGITFAATASVTAHLPEDTRNIDEPRMSATVTIATQAVLLRDCRGISPRNSFAKCYASALTKGRTSGNSPIAWKLDIGGEAQALAAFSYHSSAATRIPAPSSNCCDLNASAAHPAAWRALTRRAEDDDDTVAPSVSGTADQSRRSQ